MLANESIILRIRKEEEVIFLVELLLKLLQPPRLQKRPPILKGSGILPDPLSVLRHHEIRINHHLRIRIHFPDLVCKQGRSSCPDDDHRIRLARNELTQLTTGVLGKNERPNGVASQFLA